MRKILSRIICLTVAASFLFSFNTQAETAADEAARIKQAINDLKKQREDINNQQGAAQKQLDAAKQEKNRIETEMRAVDDDLDKTTDDLLRVTDRLNETSASLDEMELELTHAQDQQGEQYKILKQRLNFMYKNGSIGYLDIIFEAKSFPDFINRVEYINRIAKNDKTLLSKLDDTTALITETVNEIDQQKSMYEQLAAEQGQKQSELQDALVKKQDMFNRLDSDEKSYQSKLDMLSDTEDQVVALIQQKQKEAEEAEARAAAEAAAKAAAEKAAREAAAKAAAEKAAAEKAAAEKAAAAKATAKSAAKPASSRGGASASVSSSPYSGRMQWPVPGRYMLSDTYRSRYNPVNGRREFHKGIDIPAPYGTTIVAAQSGTVISAGWMGSYGYAVIIDHGNGVSTLYGHNSRVLVRSGQHVSKGQAIARAGSTGNSTGPHCHFEVRINGSAVNPARYVM